MKEAPSDAHNSVPQLWRPDGVGYSGLFLTPIFSSWLLSKNWEQLGQEGRAFYAKIWFYLSIGLYSCVIFVSYDKGFPNLIKGFNALYWVLFYFLAARPQISYVKSQKVEFERKSWGYPLLIGIVSLVAVDLLSALAFSPSEKKILEAEAPGVVNQILKESGTAASLKCDSVTIVKVREPGLYDGVATLNNGEIFKVTIRVKGDNFTVEIPKQ